MSNIIEIIIIPIIANADNHNKIWCVQEVMHDISASFNKKISEGKDNICFKAGICFLKENKFGFISSLKQI